MDIAIIGAGGQGLVVTDILLAAREAGDRVSPVAIIDDDPKLRGREVLGVPVVGTRDSLLRTPHDAVIVAIGDNALRRSISEELARRGERIAVARHPTAWLASETKVGEGSMISAGVVLLPRVQIGRGVLLNTRAAVDHESVVGDFAHVSLSAAVGANVTIGEEAFLAPGSVVTSRTKVGARTIVGAGAVVLRDLPPDVRAWGVPARVLH